jgi:hypothetical protein
VLYSTFASRRALTMPILTRKRAHHPSPLAIGALAFVLGFVGPIAVYAEVISIPSEASSSTVSALPPPTVLRGSPPSTDKSVPICPPGYTLTPGDYTKVQVAKELEVSRHTLRRTLS